VLIFLSVLFLPFAAAAQTDIQQEITDLLKENKVDEADERVDAYLKEDPGNVDALVMKGNVIYKRYLMDQFSHSILSGNENESIYDQSMGYLSAPPVILTRETANEINRLWLRAASSAPDRADIHFGICEVYSSALMKNELLRYLKRVQQAVPSEPDLPYLLADYARNLKERRRIEDALEVYEAIANMFPQHGGIRSDIAGEYYEAGRLHNAEIYINEALGKKDLDEMVYGNAFFISTIIGNYDLALKAVRSEANIVGHKHDKLYYGLVQMARQQPEWRQTLKDYIAVETENEAHKALALRLSGANFSFSDEDLKVVIELALPDHFKLPVYEAFMKAHPDKFDPAFQLAETLTYHGNYVKATDIFRDMNLSGTSVEQREAFNFYHAWALYRNEEIENAVTEWEPLLDSENFYFKSAASYFLARWELTEGNKLEASELFGSIASRSGESKYAMYSKNLLEALEAD